MKKRYFTPYAVKAMVASAIAVIVLIIFLYYR